MLSKNEIKYIQSLKAKKQRLQERLFIAEGTKLVTELLFAKQFRPVKVYAIESFFAANQTEIAGIEKEIISDEELLRISLLQHPQEALALVPITDLPFVPFEKGKWSLLLDGIQDPGNLGTILRIADWFGLEHVYATNDTAEMYNPKVVQASMGSIFRVKMHYGNCSEWLRQTDAPVYAADMNGTSIWQIGKAEPGVLIIGNEGKGISADISLAANQTISIPRLGNAESLNAGVATGILLSHLLQP